MFIIKIKYYWAKLLYIIGKIDKSIIILEEIDQDIDWKVKLLLARIYNNTEKFKLALDYSKEALKLVFKNKDRKKVIETKILLMIKLEKYEEAISFLKNENNKSEFILETIGIVNLMAQNWESAKNNFLKVLELNSKNKEALYGLGSSYYQLKEYKKSLDYYQRAAKAGYNNLNIWSGLFILNLDIGNLEEAKKYLNKLQSKYSNNVFYFYYYAKYQYAIGEVEEAYDILEKIKEYIDDTEVAEEIFNEFYNQVKRGLKS